MCQLLEDWLADAEPSDASRKVFIYYGTFTRSFVTMFEIVIGNWAPPCRLLTDNVGEHYGYLVLIYRLVTGLSVINIISAVFLQKTMNTMSQDTDIMLSERIRTEKQFKVNIEKLFQMFDVDGDGVVTRSEVKNEMRDPDVRLRCFQLGIDIHDLKDVLYLSNGGSSEAEGMMLDEFIYAADSIRKQSNSLDIARLLAQSSHMQHHVQHVQEKMERLVSEFDRMKALVLPMRLTATPVSSSSVSRSMVATELAV
jgi:hypothetical protein